MMKIQDLPNQKQYGFNSNGTAMFYGQASARAAQGLGELKSRIVKGQATASDQDLWQSIPTISADAQVGDVIKDHSISQGGQAGVVFNVRDMRKRTGNIVTVIEFMFFGHTNLKDLRTRKIEIKK